MLEIFELLLPYALQYGLTVFDYWDMTLKEINAFIKAVQEKEKMNRLNAYLQASMTANFVGDILSGKPIPPIQNVFPELFDDLLKKQQEEQDYKAMMLYKEQMLDYAKAVNQRNKANKDGENVK